ncbi:VMA21 superfamily domain-containing protein [Histoplasma capsulatum G186AR]|uniref:VMA21 superfamily domain-containing protein n=1 Tax=Ajellomyces capsulatus TaxID=5037 RepID=A0A8H7YFH5_AJECA|nr:VMA21 superfamily domain-containing protein [Histoplasma capsulatum]QSS71204.1 VMA21 superfamily domain-containing protein [Histoplasma capsulatum G186AR]
MSRHLSTTLSPIGFFAYFFDFAFEVFPFASSSLVIWRTAFKDLNGRFEIMVLAIFSWISAISERSATEHELKNLRTFDSKIPSSSDTSWLSDSDESISTNGSSGESDRGLDLIPLMSLPGFLVTGAGAGDGPDGGDEERVLCPLISRLRGAAEPPSDPLFWVGSLWLEVHLS